MTGCFILMTVLSDAQGERKSGVIAELRELTGCFSADKVYTRPSIVACIHTRLTTFFPISSAPGRVPSMKKPCMRSEKQTSSLVRAFSSSRLRARKNARICLHYAGSPLLAGLYKPIRIFRKKEGNNTQERKGRHSRRLHHRSLFIPVLRVAQTQT